MADQRRISMADIVVGEPMLWDAYGVDGKLLLRKGYVVENERQVEGLIERGLYITASHADSLHKPEPVKKLEVPSVLRLLNLANKRLEKLLYGLGGETDAEAKFLEVVKAISYATDLNRDIALGCLQLNQSAGNYSVRHCVDTAVLSLLVMRAMHKTPEEITTVMAAALTMNVGMLRAHDQLESKTEPLTAAEIEVIKNHPQVGVKILQQAGITNEDWLAHVLYHHENADGSGYPHGKTASDIGQNSRILALADHYCAAVSHRNYRKTLPHAAALRDVLMKSGKADEPMLAAYFIKELGTYPPGTFVRLDDGEVGVVTERGSAQMTPIVHALVGPRGAPLSFPIRRDTAKPRHGIREVIAHDQATLRFSLHQLWGDEANL
ncbi:MAG TPA: HD domain-containing phosphohydrolase [Burkholderiaceae bacterium]|jgi:HD-GYP domain-containing protein (c-di-GMP phosphodiesterase class II)